MRTTFSRSKLSIDKMAHKFESCCESKENFNGEKQEEEGWKNNVLTIAILRTDDFLEGMFSYGETS